MVSIVVPTYNEKDNLRDLLVSIHLAFKGDKNLYEIIVVDDLSNDGTWDILKEETQKYPLKIYKKIGLRGKAFSLFQGFKESKGEIVVMIDGDLQYPPESIPNMVAKLNEADVVVANRKHYLSSPLRKILSKSFNFIFCKSLFGIGLDVQSGLKAFKREVLTVIDFQPRSPWTFDLEFLVRAKEAGFKLTSYNINFLKRKKGQSKINTLSASWEIGKNALALKFTSLPPQNIPADSENSMKGAGIGYKKKKYITHTTLADKHSAIKGFSNGQKLIIIGFLALILFGIVFDPFKSLIYVVGILSTIYFADLIFNFYLIWKSIGNPPEIIHSEDDLKNLQDSELPLYSILCPLYKEANIVPHFLKAINDLDWPKDKLEVLLLLEEDDLETIKEVSELRLPEFVQTLVVPNSSPKTKPKACNYGLAHAKGKFLVIYDAEDIPDPLQLKKAYLAFQKLDKSVFCLQAKLNYHNTNQNLLTRFFTAEYSLWFDVILTGLQAIQTAIPLGGSSNHFRTKDLINLKGWDPFNVTEDADLGIRLFKKGFSTAIIDSTTLEEANSNLLNWLRQRSRWIKGYMQTYLVHMRNPIEFYRKNRIHALFFQLVMGGKIAFLFINPLLWGLTILYFTARSKYGEVIESLFPSVIFYMALTCLVFGNFLHMFYYMIGCAKREKWNVVKFVYLIPIYWLIGSAAAVNALYQLLVKPHYWEKTVHGLHLEKSKFKYQVTISAWTPHVPKLPRISISSGSLLVIASILANFFNFLNNAYLGRRISIEEFGTFSLSISFLYFATIPLTALARTVTHKSAFLLGKYKTAVIKFWQISHKNSILTGLVITFIWCLLTPVLTNYFRVSSVIPFYAFAPVWLIGMVFAVDSGFLNGNLKFYPLALITFVEPLLRLLLTVGLVELNLASYIYASIPIAMLLSLGIAYSFSKKIKTDKNLKASDQATTFPKIFFLTEAFTRISIFAFLSFDLILAKHFLSAHEAGQYAFLSLTGKMIFFVSTLFSQFIYPLVAKNEGANRESKSIFYKLLLYSTFSSFAAYLVIGFFGKYTIPLLFGENSRSIVLYLPIYSLSMLCFAISSTIVFYYQSKKKYFFSLVALTIACAQVIEIFLYHKNISEFVVTMATTGIDSLIIIFALHILYGPSLSLVRNFKDLISLFNFPLNLRQKTTEASKNILIYNWRDKKHVWAGGAEVYIQEVAKRLGKDGHNVTIFAGNDGKNLPYEEIDGINIIRKGGFYTVYFWAMIYYLLRFKGKFDIIIDSENGIPFFTPLYAKIPIICLIHHVHQEIFRKHLNFPLSNIAQLLEGKLMPLVYRNINIVTISESSKTELENLGFGKRNQISIIHPGINISEYRLREKTRTPSVVYLGRLKPYKSVETAIYAIAHIIEKIPQIKLVIAGEGESRRYLETLVKNLNLDKYIKFAGKVSNIEKINLLSKSWVMIHPSSMEGWGIAAIEANAAGTPVVAANVPGLRNAVKNPHSGFLVPWGNPSKFAEKIELIITNKQIRKELETGARGWAENFSWDKSTDKFIQVIREESK